MTPCIIWRKSVSRNGYGQATPDHYQGRTTRLAHRRAWERAHGPIPDGLTIDHLCRNKLCINVDHMEVVTMRVNVLRSDNAAALNARRTACHRGHPFDEANTYHYHGQRICRTCRRETMRLWRSA